MSGKNEIITYHKISDLYKRLNLPFEQEMDFSINDLKALHPTLPFSSPTFRTDYYSFVFIKNGRGSYTTDELVFPTQPGTIYFTNPGHLKAFEMEALEEAYIITLTESFLKEQVHADIFDEFPFLLAEKVPPSTLNPEDFQEFETMYLQILAEFEKNSPFKYKIIGNLFVVLLLKIKEYFWSDYNPIEEGDRSSEIVKVFKENLEKHYRNLHAGSEKIMFQVQDYARLQSLHPNYLSNVITSKTGKTVNKWISEKTIAEAKSMLLRTELTAKEIGYRLGFQEPTHFNSYFKKHTSQSPGNFRKNGNS